MYKHYIRFTGSCNPYLIKLVPTAGKAGELSNFFMLGVYIYSKTRHGLNNKGNLLANLT